MRWYWIDRFLEFESGRYAKAVKNVSLSEEHIHDHFPGYPVLPKSLIIEGIAQTGGLLVCEINQFTEKVILAKIPQATFYGGEVLPGEQLVYTATIEFVKADGAMIVGTSHKNGELQAKMEIFFAHLNDKTQEALFDPEQFLRMMRMLGAYDVGHAADVSRLQPSPRLLSLMGTG